MQKELEKLGIKNPKNVYHNLSIAGLVEHSLAKGEGTLSETGALVVNTGKYTGRSPDDKFIVKDETTENEVDWGKVNKAISKESFDAIHKRIVAYLQNRDIYVFDGYIGADPSYRKNIRIINEKASQNLFIKQMLIQPDPKELPDFEPEYTIIAAPGFHCIPEMDNVNSEAAIVLDYKDKLVLIAGSHYAGEIKKSVFSIMNYILPTDGVFPMHCSANMGADGDTALFFGLSGTGKTTLSADPNRKLIGDDEHGWSKDGIFNFEGGCYAKCINLSKKNEPQIWDAMKFGALLENVVMDPDTRKLDFNDESLTENTRACYPIDFIPNAQIPGIGATPTVVVFLTADAFGVLPPVAKLTREQAMYYFISGYTARLAGTERGITEPQATFSTCFGAPFLPYPAIVYANLLAKYMESSGASVYLVNTGWVGGPAGNGGERISIKDTRSIITAIITEELAKVEYKQDPVFDLYVPLTCPGIDDEILNPQNMWKNKEAYTVDARNLANMFQNNFKKYDVPKEIVDAGPNSN